MRLALIFIPRAGTTIKTEGQSRRSVASVTSALNARSGYGDGVPELSGGRRGAGKAGIPDDLSARSWQAMLESVDHWPMATLTSRPFGGKPPLVAAVRRDSVVGILLLRGVWHTRGDQVWQQTRIGVWRTVLWGTQWGQLDSGRQVGVQALFFLRREVSCRATVAVAHRSRSVRPSSVQLDPRSRGGVEGAALSARSPR